MITAKEAREITKNNCIIKDIERQIQKAAESGMLHINYNCNQWPDYIVNNSIEILKSFGYDVTIHVGIEYDKFGYEYSVPRKLLITW